jgi:hypothetical protein
MDYAFNNFSRSFNDTEYLDQRAIQNMNGSSYYLKNYSGDMQKSMNFALMQPFVFYNGSGINSSTIDINSKLTIGSLQTHPRSRIDLIQRPFVTVPYLGRGTVDPVSESQLMQGEIYTNKKSFNQLSEVSYLPLSNTPLIPSIKETITNPNFLVENNSGGVRGGLPSRELMRDN